MSILITTPTQLDSLMLSCQNFVLSNAVTNIPDYNNTVKGNLTLFSYTLADKSFRSVATEGMLMLFKRRHGLVLPPNSYFYSVNDTVTPQQALQDWGALQVDPKDKNVNRFVLDHLAYYFNFNTNLFYKFETSALTLLNIPVV